MTEWAIFMHTTLEPRVPETQPGSPGIYEAAYQRQLLLLFLLTVSLRLIFSFFIFPRWAPQADLLGDDGYDRIAQSLSQGYGYVVAPGGWPTMKRVPAYPLFLAGIFKLVGTDLRITQAVQAVLDGLSVVVLARLTRRIFGSSAGWVAGGLLALYPLSILYSSRFYTESLYTLLLLIFAGLLLKLSEERRPWIAMLGGLTLGLLVLTRSVTLALPLFVFPVFIWAGGSMTMRSFRLQASLIMLAVMTLALSPWIARKYRLTGRLLVGGTTLGAPVYHGFYVPEHWRWGEDRASLHRQAFDERRALGTGTLDEVSSAADEYRVDREALEAVEAKMSAHPMKTAGPWARNLLLVWFLTRNHWAAVLIGVYHFTLLGLALATLGRLWRAHEGNLLSVAPLMAIVLCFVVVHALVFPFTRYLVPVMPLVMVFAGSTVTRRFLHA